MTLSIRACSLPGCGGTFALLNPKEFNFCNVFHKISFIGKHPELSAAHEELKLLYRWGSLNHRSGDELSEPDLRFRLPTEWGL